jgi:type I restriction enzyme S subunit
VSDLPPGWVQAKLADVASTQLGRMLSTRRETGVYPRPYLRNRDVQWGHINVSDLPTMDFRPEDTDRFRLSSGDGLVCEGGEVGRAAIWKDQLAECYFQKAIHRVRTSEALSPEFLRYLLEHYARTKAFADLTSGSTIAHLPQEDLRNLPVDLPPRAEQERIVAAIEEQFSRLEAGVRALVRVIGPLTGVQSGRVGQLRSAILGTAFSGRLAVQDTNDEPVSAILERIAAEHVASNGHRVTRTRNVVQAHIEKVTR